MTVQPTAAEMIDAMRRKARELWGDEFTLKVTLWEDGDFRLVAYHRVHDDEADDSVLFEELWHQPGETPRDKAAFGKTRQHEYGTWAPDRGDDEGEPELVDLT